MRHLATSTKGGWGARRHFARLITGLIVAGLTLWLAFRRTDGALVLTALEDSRPTWMFAALGTVVLTVAAGAVRWRLLFHPHQGGLRLFTLLHGILVGQMLNILVPMRFGDLARAWILGSAEALPIARVLATIGVEKLADLTMAGLAAGCLLVFVSLPEGMHAAGQALVATGAMAVALAAWLASIRGGGQIQAAVIRRLPPVIRQAVERHLARAAEGLGALRQWRVAGAVGMLSAGVLLLAASTNYVLFQAFDLRLPVTAAVVLFIAIQAGNVLVPVPGNLGVFHYVTVLVLSTYSVDPHTALGYAIVLYMVALVPKIVAGSLLLVFVPRRVDLRQLAGRPPGVSVPAP